MTDSAQFHEQFGGEEAGQGNSETARAIVVPVPYEATVSYGEGARRGPSAILRASAELEFVNEETGADLWQPGEVATSTSLEFSADSTSTAAETHLEAITAASRSVFSRKQFLLTLGGEHTITAGSFRAAAEAYPGLGLVGIDAHLDLRQEYGGSAWSHACVLRRILEEHNPITAWVGARSVCREEWDYLAAETPERAPLQVFWAHQIAEDLSDQWIDAIIEILPPHIYLSIDVDGLDPSVIPGTGTPEPGGLSYRTVLKLIHRIATCRQIVAADIVELAPIEGQQGSEFTAAKISARLIAEVLDNRRSIED